jgi:hypothetical protein
MEFLVRQALDAPRAVDRLRLVRGLGVGRPVLRPGADTSELAFRPPSYGRSTWLCRRGRSRSSPQRLFRERDL